MTIVAPPPASGTIAGQVFYHPRHIHGLPATHVAIDADGSVFAYSSAPCVRPDLRVWLPEPGTYARRLGKFKAGCKDWIAHRYRITP